MDNRKLGILAMVAAAMVVWAVVQARLSGGRRPTPTGPTYLIQGLDPGQIGSIVIGKGKNPIKIARQEGKFVVTNKSNYPADTKQINDLINKAVDIKTGDLCTSDPKNQADLQVTEDKAKSVVKFFKADGSLLTGVIVGESKEAGQGTFVRLASSNDVYTTGESPWFRDRAIDFVNQDLTAVKREDVNAVSVTTPEGKYTLRSGKGDNVSLVDLPADKKLKDADAKSVISALTSLRFEDVNAPAQIPGLNFDHEYVCRLNNSTEYHLQLAKKGAKTYLQCDADFTDKTPVTLNPNQKDSQAQLKKKEAKLLGQENALKFTQQHKGWIYEIADWKAKYLTMKLPDLLEDKEKPVAKPTDKPSDKKAETPAPAAAVTGAKTPAVEPNQAKPAPKPAAAVQPAPVTPPKAPEPNQPQAAPPAATATGPMPAPAAAPAPPAKTEKPADANAPKAN